MACAAGRFMRNWALMSEFPFTFICGADDFLVDRLGKERFATAAREVEDVLLTHPEGRLAAVVGVPDEIRGEEVKAYVVAPETSSDELTTWCAERLASFKVPRFWEFRDDLPLTASHRVEKAKL